MEKEFIIVILAVIFSGCAAVQETRSLPDEMEPEHIKSVMTKVADWQLANPFYRDTKDWTWGAFDAGLTALAQMADTDIYYDTLLDISKRDNWQLGSRVYHADDHAVGQMYIEMYKKYKEPHMIAAIQERFDFILKNKPTNPLIHGPGHNKRYIWSDALFMAPPVWAKLARITGDENYLDFMNHEWWDTADLLYDQEEHLYFRDSRFFDQREANGKKIFWSRGNGWVFGGLVRVLEELPDDHPDRQRYETLFKEMAARLKAIQPEDDLWHSSLLDTVSFPSVEASGSGFFCYGLAWGINHGLLDADEYLPSVMRAWKKLVSCVHPNGKLGYVQAIGDDPRNVDADDTGIYGVGSFLLAGSEVYKITIRNCSPVKKFSITNPTLLFRDSETVSLNWEEINKTVPGLTKENVAIYDFKTNRLLVTQILEAGKNPELLFQTDFAPGEKKYFWIMKQPSGLPKPNSKLTTFCRFVPERKDDFAWENDKVAFRMYGPALEDETITCGIDAWVKCVPYPVIDKFYKNGDYHTNHGEGGDFYKVGETLGCGGAAPLVDGKLCLPSKNFSEWKILANGPIRSVFELSYEPWKAGSITVSETKRISINLGSNLNKIECYYSSDDGQAIPVAAGIVLRDSWHRALRMSGNIINFWLPAAGDNAAMGCGVLVPTRTQVNTVESNGHILLQTTHKTDEPFVYYSGSCWNKNDEFMTIDKWQRYLETFSKCADNPVIARLDN